MSTIIHYFLEQVHLLQPSVSYRLKHNNLGSVNCLYEICNWRSQIDEQQHKQAKLHKTLQIMKQSRYVEAYGQGWETNDDGLTTNDVLSGSE